MKSIDVEELSLEAFMEFGCYRDLLHPQGECIGTQPVEFFRDMLRIPITDPSFSVCRVIARPFVIDKTEMHSRTAEATLCLDADTLVHVGPATPIGTVPLDRFRVFFVPKGTIVAIHPGVWHHAAFLHDTDAVAANVIGILPERTYANDSVIIDFNAEDRIIIIT